MTPPIAILGAGPSGLLFARMLELHDIDYIVFERETLDDGAGLLSGTLDLHVGSGQLALQEAGLFNHFRQKARYDTPIKMADQHGKIIVSFAEEGNSERPEIDRVDLRQMLLNSIPNNKIRWNHKATSVQKLSSGAMTVQFEDGSQHSGFQLVVAADGAWTKARTLVTNAKPQYSGLYYVTTKLTPASPYFAKATKLVGKGAYLAVGDCKQISAQKLGDEAYYIAIGLYLPESWSKDNSELIQDPEKLRQYLLDIHFTQWPGIHTNLIRYSDSAFRPWPLYAMPPEALSWKTFPGVALIGDAAHVSTPFVGEGVNCSMYDSVQLARQIFKHGLSQLDAAVAAYEAEMFPRAVELITRSRQSGELMFAPDAPAGFVEFLSHGAAQAQAQ